MSKKLIRFDWAVKKLLRNKANFAVLEGFLSELLFDDIKIERILESEGNQDTDINKYNRVDILTQNSKKELVIIEIQNSYEIDYFQRMAFGAAKALTEYLDIGQPYSEIKKVIAVNIVYFNLGQGEDYVYEGGTNFVGMHKKDILQLSTQQKEAFAQQEVRSIFPEYYLLKVNQFDNIAKDTLDEWIYFLKNSEVKDEFRAKGLTEAKEVLDVMRLDENANYSYNRHLDALRVKASEALTEKIMAEAKGRRKGRKEGLEKGRQKGLQEGLQKGQQQEKIQIAKNSIAIGLDNAMITTITGLSIDQIEALRGELS